MEAKECKEYAIHMTEACRREYSKMSKRADRRLRKVIESELDVLRYDPHRGSKLERDLVGMRSIHIDQFSYRIVYGVDHAACRIVIYRIRHRSASYSAVKK